MFWIGVVEYGKFELFLDYILKSECYWLIGFGLGVMLIWVGEEL